jgi:hypothetical protein
MRTGALGANIAATLIPTGLDHDSQEASSPFLGKRTKKLLQVLTGTFPDRSATAQTKAFCFFFSKKKALHSFL